MIRKLKDHFVGIHERNALKLASAAIWEHLPLSNEPKNPSATCSTSRDTENPVAGPPTNYARGARIRSLLLAEMNVHCSKKMVGQCKDGFDVSPGRSFHAKSRNDCAHPGFKEGFAERSRFGNEDADVFYESGGQESKCVAQGSPSKGKGIALGAGKCSAAAEKNGCVIASYPSITANPKAATGVALRGRPPVP
jgi:hypothetical protein